ncbi:MAG: TlpA family protein disulfide reductase [Alphaproteobacteria bacterium]|nr:TlpA family protein disulfide reductase [Alphaproteobacteria bacterium]|tara:strand:+ start:3047 stop:3565 length:519 start_codon:yes stop_codon:yes gene_type:complete
MKQGLLVFLLMIFSFPVWAAPEGFDVSKPVALPEIVFQDEQGQEVKLSAFKGKVVVLNLWATWCAPCVTEMPDLNTLQKRLEDKDIEIITVSMDRSIEKAGQFYEKTGIDVLPLYWDSTRSLGFDLGFNGLPATMIVNPDGLEVARVSGPLAWLDKEIETFLLTVAEGSHGQ